MSAFFSSRCLLWTGHYRFGYGPSRVYNYVVRVIWFYTFCNGSNAVVVVATAKSVHQFDQTQMYTQAKTEAHTGTPT